MFFAPLKPSRQSPGFVGRVGKGVSSSTRYWVKRYEQNEQKGRESFLIHDNSFYLGRTPCSVREVAVETEQRLFHPPYEAPAKEWGIDYTPPA